MRRFVIPTLAAALTGSLLTGCPDRSLSKVEPIQDHVHKASIPVNLNRNIDILFVVDNSGSMAAEQASLTANFPEFINVLSTIPGGLPDVHIGVVSTNVGSGSVAIGGCSTVTRPQGDDGNLQTNMCAGLLNGAQYVSDIKLASGMRDQNYSGDLGTLFGCMARLGISGCGFEAPLESMYRALQPGKNGDFIRDDAYLAIIFLGDEDDCSAKEGGGIFGDPTGSTTSPLGPRTSFRCHEFGIECDNDPNPRSFGTRTGCQPRNNSQYIKDVQPYIDYVKSLKSDTKNIIVAGIIGNVTEAHTVDIIPDTDDDTRPMVGPACTSASGTAFPGFRIQAFLDAFPERNFTTTICNENLTGAMTEIGEIIKIAVGSPCIDRAISDRNPNLEGVQAECSVADVTNPDSEERTEDIIAACDSNGNQPPCWRFISDPVQCENAPDNRAIDVNRGGASVPLGTFLEVQCVTE